MSCLCCTINYKHSNFGYHRLPLYACEWKPATSVYSHNISNILYTYIYIYIDIHIFGNRNQGTYPVLSTPSSQKYARVCQGSWLVHATCLQIRGVGTIETPFVSGKNDGGSPQVSEELPYKSHEKSPLLKIIMGIIAES